MRRFLRSLSVVMIPSRVSADDEHRQLEDERHREQDVRAEGEERLGLQDVVELVVVVVGQELQRVRAAR